MDSLPSPSQRRLAIRVTPDALRHVRSGHPWIFDDSITSVGLGSSGDPARAGELAVIFDRDRAFAAIGLFDPDSPIRIRVLHKGKPTTIDDAFWHASLQSALDRRDALLEDGQHTGFRWVNGENDGLGGLVVDRYAGVTVVKLYSAAWFPHLDAVVNALDDVLPSDAVVIRLARNVAKKATFGLADGDTLRGEIPAELEFLENGLRFGVDVRHGQKTGTFLDQRWNRQRTATLVGGQHVLDVFCCTGGFTVAALAAGAASVHAVDLNEQAIETVRSNVERNDLPIASLTTTVGDAFDEMARLALDDRQFGVVIVDPPSFAPRQSDVRAALNAYRRLTRLAVALVEPGGMLVQASCTARIEADEFGDLVEDGIEDSGRRIDTLEMTGHDIDHPATFAQGHYLKAVFARLH